MSDQIHIIKKSRESSRMGWCVHYAGMLGPGLKTITHCEAGVEYAAVKVAGRWQYKYEGDEGGPYTKTQAFPCFKEDHTLARVKCEHCRFRTDEEKASYRAEVDRHIAEMGKARKAIVAASEGKRGVSGRIPCPVCSTGELRYSVAGYNGHIHAACSTPECVRWME